MIDQQDAFVLFVQRDLSLAFDLPGDTPGEMLTLVEEICTLRSANNT